MTDSQVQRYLKIEELYRKILDVVDEETIDAIVASPGFVRGLLDAIFNAGKIEGRLVSHTVHGHPVPRTGDRLIEDWQRIVDSVS